MRHAALEDDCLEAIVPEGWLEARPEPRPRPRLRITPKWIGVLAGVVVAASLFAGYAALAISGIRALERHRDRAAQLNAERHVLSNRLLASVVAHEDTAVVAEATRALLLEHRDRAIALAEQASHVRAVDPGVRRLRTAIVGALMLDAHDLEHAAEAPVPPAAPTLGRGYPYADRLLEIERRQWRLREGRVPEPPEHLRAADTALVKLAMWTDQKTGARLLVNGAAGLRILELDSSTTTSIELEEGIGSVAAGPDFVAVGSGGQVTLLDADDPYSRRQFSDGRITERNIVPAAAGDGVWVQDRAGLGPAVRIDRQAQATGDSARSHGELVADLGPTLLWTPPPSPEVNRSLPVLSTYILSDVRTNDVIARWDRRELFAASAAGMAWRVDSERLEVTDALGRVRSVPQRTDLFPRSAAFSHDGRRLAVGWGDGQLDVIDLESGALADSVRTSGPAVLRWTRSGTYVFFATATGLGWFKPGEDDVRRLRIRNAGGSLVAAF